MDKCKESCNKNQKTALIFGVTGQDGSYLADFLLEKNYQVYGVSRRASTSNTSRILHLLDNEAFHLVEGDVTDSHSVRNSFCRIGVKPDEVYFLAAQSHVGTSFSEPLHTFDATGTGCLNVLEAIKDYCGSAHFYNAASSEMFGSCYSVAKDSEGNESVPFQNENTPMIPNSPYAIAKLAAFHFTRLYREMHGIHASSGILFNHESSRRGENFVSRKITKYVARLKFDHTLPPLKLGNLSAFRDWGWAPDYVRAMWMMLQQETPDDYVVATGISYTVDEFLVEAFRYIGISDYHKHVVIDPAFYRPCEVPYLLGDSTKAREKLGWQPTINFEQLVHLMIDEDVKLVRPVALSQAQNNKRQVKSKKKPVGV